MRRNQSDPTTLGVALLGLVGGEPRSGYALRKVFETTPIGRFSSSPGSIYPALRKLEDAGLIEARRFGRTTRVLYLTRKGRRVLRTWLAKPVSAEEYDRDPDAVMLRFAFLDGANDAELTARFLASFETAVKENLTHLRSFLRSEEGQALTLHGTLAVEHGVAACEAALRWARRAVRVTGVASSAANEENP